ncbi:putative PAB-dependent poly(A)-specific ribonuclease subunit 2 [Trichinella spiralis]|uniref:putative PAB-dependent poly(A)-specific ribonuclease subunit 2 n=1 Tax=Trichinella spiralis TaxID=6334 RepID=UPI0001EFD0A0|nr:putative PAB-dependent poly(A)-specific ribonuclease subunit 2 [Trichinella spiralis]
MKVENIDGTACLSRTMKICFSDLPNDGHNRRLVKAKRNSSVYSAKLWFEQLLKFAFGHQLKLYFFQLPKGGKLMFFKRHILKRSHDKSEKQCEQQNHQVN